MYSVMLADDDYPVIELLSETIDWESLGFRLVGAFENGESAWEQAQLEAPDILITDIGMPRMDGLELTARIKERKPGARIVILSCHNEFKFAQQAMRLNVQEYLLKESLDPEDLVRLLLRLKEGLDEERQLNGERLRLRALASESMELRKEQTIKNFIHQPLLSPEIWKREARAYGLFLEGECCLPVIAYVEDYLYVKHRFASEQTLRFAVANVLKEVLGHLEARALHVGYCERRQLLLFPYKPSLKTNIYETVENSLRTIRETMRKVLKIRLTFRIGSECDAPEKLKRQLVELVSDEGQRFYLEPGDIARSRHAVLSQQDLFACYDAASSELREAIVGKRPEDVRAAAEVWMERIRQERYPPAAVKEWVLKLLLDLRLKLFSLPFVRSGYSPETLHKEIADIGSLAELREWLIGHLMTAAEGTGAAPYSKRYEVNEACKYVSLNLNRKIGLEEVAEKLHLNASYFSRLFKKETGVTFIEYVTRMKMERAKELLDQTQHTVGEICELLGYDNQSYFIKTFKAHTGLTPMEYRG